MANEEHLVTLKKGPEIWNRWREAHPGEAPDLRRAKLIGCDLRGLDLQAAQMGEADLRNANLANVCLAEANLEASNFFGAEPIFPAPTCEPLTANAAKARVPSSWKRPISPAPTSRAAF